MFLSLGPCLPDMDFKFDELLGSATLSYMVRGPLQSIAGICTALLDRPQAVVPAPQQFVGTRCR